MLLDAWMVEAVDRQGSVGTVGRAFLFPAPGGQDLVFIGVLGVEVDAEPRVIEAVDRISLLVCGVPGQPFLHPAADAQDLILVGIRRIEVDLETRMVEAVEAGVSQDRFAQGQAGQDKGCQQACEYGFLFHRKPLSNFCHIHYLLSLYY